MLTADKITSFIHRCTDTRAVAAWVVFFSLLICSIPISARQKHSSADLVYCPLQKTWVKGGQPETYSPPVDHSLDEICATTEHKQHFVIDLAKSLFSKRIESSRISRANLFFQYLEKRKQAFAEVVPFKNAPDYQFVRAATKEKSGAANYRVSFKRALPSAFGLEALARPPTSNDSVKFNFQFASELKKISRNINPRSPPVHI